MLRNHWPVKNPHKILFRFYEIGAHSNAQRKIKLSCEKYFPLHANNVCEMITPEEHRCWMELNAP